MKSVNKPKLYFDSCRSEERGQIVYIFKGMSLSAQAPIIRLNSIWLHLSVDACQLELLVPVGFVYSRHVLMDSYNLIGMFV